MSFKQNLITFSSRFQGDDFGKSFPLNHFIPVYHTVSDEHLPHLKHIIHYKNIKDFEKDLDFTLKHFQFVNWDEFKDLQTGNFKPKKKIALLTFDDGLREFYDVVAPILERKGIYAINFINPKFIDNKELMFRCKASLVVDVLNNIRNLNPEIYKISETGLSSKEVLKQKIKEISYKNRMILDQIAELLEIDFQEFLQHQKPYMALEQLKKISQKGFGISNHGFDHPLYKDLTLHQQVENTDQARHYIKQNNFIHESFAFPFTDFGVKQEFFDEVFKNQNLFCSFGCAGIKYDSFSKNFQRIPMENGKVAEQTLKEETAYFNLKKLFNKNTIRRI